MGCGESKHAVVTTDSISLSKRLTSQNTNKVENLKIEDDLVAPSTNDRITNVSKDTNQHIIDSLHNIGPTNNATILPLANVVYKEEVTKKVDEKVTINNTRNNISKVLNDNYEKKTNARKRMEIFGAQFKENERESSFLSMKTYDDHLSPKNTKSKNHSQSCDYVEFIGKKEEISNEMSPKVLKNKHEHPIIETEDMKPLVVQKNDIECDYRNLPLDFHDNKISNKDSRLETQTSPHDLNVEATTTKDKESSVILRVLCDDAHEEQLREVKVIKTNVPQEKDNEENNTKLSLNYYVDNIPLVNCTNTECHSSHDEINVEDANSNGMSKMVNKEHDEHVNELKEEENAIHDMENEVENKLSYEFLNEYLSSSYDNVVKSVVVDTEKKPNNLFKDDHDKQPNEVKIVETFMIQEKENNQENKEVLSKSNEDYSNVKEHFES